MIMPSAEYNSATDRDVASIIAYIRSRPPVDNAPEGRKLGPIGRIVSLMAAKPLFGALAIEHDRPHREHLEPAVTAEYGGYLASACKGCHGPDWTGASSGGTTGPNLTPDPTTGLGGWTLDDFRRAFQQGRVPDGSTLDSAMPWYVFAKMTDDEVQALWMFLSTLEPREGIARRAPTP
jgi:cytochrome c553